MDSMLIRTRPPRGHRVRLAVFSLPALAVASLLIMLAVAALVLL
jgi:hypothetical protein